MTTTIPGYVIFSEINRNDQFVTYQGIRENDQKPVLIKTLATDHPNLDDIAHLKNEFELTKGMENTEIIKPLIIDKFQNQFYLIFEDLGFETLRKLVKTRHFSLEENLKIALNLSHAIGSYQSDHLIHKDLTPENIFVNPETLEVKISGFGYATRLQRQKLSVKSPTSLEGGQAAYISPEQTGRMNRDLDYRSDFYSLGVILYELFTGKKPFSSTDIIEIIHAHIAVQPLSPHEINLKIPKTVSDIIMKLMSKTVEERYSSISSLERDLNRCLLDLHEKGMIEPFEIGSNDVSSVFQISQKLYGREKNIAILETILDTLPQDPPQLCLLAGYSGIGKSSIIYELQKPIYERGGFFIAGKFDQFKTNIPYSAFIHALQDLIQHILTESEERIAYWKEKILESLGVNAGVITDVLPELKLIIGDPPKPQDLDTEQTYNRFSILFQLFIKTFSSPLTPLIIFLDDMQWIDSASLKLIEMLITSHQTRGLLIVGAYRSNEVDRYHPFMVAMERVKQNYGKITEIDVLPLNIEEVTHLIGDTLHQPYPKVRDLAKVVYDKTQGNPFFINQILTFLYEEKLITFNQEKGEWVWSLEKIQSAKVTDNIVTLLINKLQKCSPITQDILKIASCTGHSFDAGLINRIADYPPEVVLHHLQEAIDEGFIVPDEHITEIYWESKHQLQSLITPEGKTRSLKFQHDRVQQAAYSLTPPEERKKIHYKIGKIILGSTNEQNKEDKIFDIAYQINNAFDLIKDPKEKLEYAKLNLIAGEKAMKAVAYRTAIDYLRFGLNFLPNERWKFNYNLAFPLQLHLAECSFLTGEYESAQELFLHTLNHAKTDQEKIQIYVLRIKLFISTTQYEEAIQNGRLALKLLGVDLPKVTSKLQILKELLKVRWNLFGRDSVSVLNLPTIDDPQKTQIINIMFLLIAPAYLSTKDLYAYIVLKGLNMSLTWGNCPNSSYYFAAYGIILNILFKDLKGSALYGKIALDLSQRFSDQSAIPATKFLVGAFIMPLHKHLRYSIEVLKSGFEIGITVGDFIYGVYALAQLMSNQYLSGKNLNELNHDLQEYKDFVSKIKAHNRGYMFIGAHQMILALKGKTHHPSMMGSDIFNEDEFFKSLQENNFPLSLFFVYVFKMQLTFLFEKMEETIAIGKKAEEIANAVKGHPINIERDFYYALAICQLASERRDESIASLLKEVKPIAKRLKTFADSCPENYLHKYLLIKAEMTRLEGGKESAIELYDKAIESARENDYIQNEAIANELFAKFWLAQNKLNLAKQYIVEAHYDYYSWGADAKVKDLEDKYPQILNRRAREKGPDQPLNEKPSDIQSQSLDLAAIFKTSEVLSGEIELETLMKELLKIVLENAGAERVVLILEKEGKWLIQAEKKYNDVNLNVNKSIEKSNNLLALSLIMYVLRTKEPVVLNDAEKEGLFTSDPYIVFNHIKSLMALPLTHQGKLIGVLYLENNLTAQAFTPERVEILKLLSSQMANSLENAILYSRQANLTRDLQVSNTKLEDYSQNLERKVYLRTHELKEKNEQLQETLRQIKDMQRKLLQQEKLVSLGNIAKTIASDMKNPLNYIFNFAEMSQELVNDLNKGEETDPQKTLELLNQNLKKINEHAKKADEIITSLLNDSRGQDDTKEMTDINKLIRDYADLVYYKYYKRDPLFSLTIETHYDPTLPKVPVIPQNIGRVIYTMIDNACNATDIKKKENSHTDYSPNLIISTFNQESQIMIKIRDNGIGIVKEVLDTIFTNFMTTKSEWKGSGIALSISHDIIVQEHKGTISIDSEPGQFTEVTITLPVSIT